MTDYGVVLFHTTSAVMKAEKLLLGKGLTLKLIPTPRQFSTDCGLSLRFEWDKKEVVESILAANRLENAGVFHLAQ
jgi:hypothetical protein